MLYCHKRWSIEVFSQPRFWFSVFLHRFKWVPSIKICKYNVFSLWIFSFLHVLNSESFGKTSMMFDFQKVLRLKLRMLLVIDIENSWFRIFDIQKIWFSDILISAIYLNNYVFMNSNNSTKHLLSNS